MTPFPMYAHCSEGGRIHRHVIQKDFPAEVKMARSGVGQFFYPGDSSPICSKGSGSAFVEVDCAQ